MVGILCVSGGFAIGVSTGFGSRWWKGEEGDFMGSSIM